MPVKQIVEQARIKLDQQPVEHAVITGGEPMLPKQMVELCQQLKSLGLHLTIETAGTICRNLVCDLMSISPKFSNSDPDQGRAGEWRKRHQQNRQRPDVVRQLIQQYSFQLKFVVDQPDDLHEITDYLEQLPTFDRSLVLLMPQGIDADKLDEKAGWLRPLAQKHGFTFCPRQHIHWYGNRRGT